MGLIKKKKIKLGRKAAGKMKKNRGKSRLG